MAVESMAVPTEPLLEEKLRALEDYLRRLGGPGQRTICSLGSLEPGPPVKWYALAKKLQAENTMASVIRLYRIPY